MDTRITAGTFRDQTGWHVLVVINGDRHVSPPFDSLDEAERRARLLETDIHAVCLTIERSTDVDASA